MLSIPLMSYGMSYGPATGVDCDMQEASVITLKWDPYASETGLYTVDGCEGASPTLHLKAGSTYVFDQSDASNWYHPVGFAYEPGGAHNDCTAADPVNFADTDGECPELGGEDGGSTLLYHVDGMGVTDDESGFGLDAYEPLFFYPEEDWEAHALAGTPFQVELTVPDVQSFYYFCHIHSAMSAIIKVTGASENAPAPLLHEHFFVPPPEISEFDAACGTVGVSKFATNAACSDKHFLCGADLSSPFNQCMQAIDCEMHHDMAVQTDPDPAVTFMRQMIPHHANAVSMAKILLKHGDVADEVKTLANNIINGQNYQIQQMQSYLGEKLEQTSLCYADPCIEYCSGSRRNRRLLFAATPTGCVC